MTDTRILFCTNLHVSIRTNIAVSLYSARAKSVPQLAENWLKHVEIILYDFSLVFSQVEQVVDHSVNLGFESFDVRPFNLLAAVFEPVEQFSDAIVGAGNRDGRLLATLDVAAVDGGVDVLGASLAGIPVVGVHRRVVDCVRPPSLDGEITVHVALHLGVCRVSSRLPLVDDVVEFAVVVAEVCLREAVGLAIEVDTVHNFTGPIPHRPEDAGTVFGLTG